MGLECAYTGRQGERFDGVHLPSEGRPGGKRKAKKVALEEAGECRNCSGKEGGQVDKSCRPRKEGGPDNKQRDKSFAVGVTARAEWVQAELRRLEMLQFCADEQRGKVLDGRLKADGAEWERRAR